jgi:hypothetical protein
VNVSEHKLMTARKCDEYTAQGLPLWEVQGYGTVTDAGRDVLAPWFDVRLTLPDGARVDVLAVVRGDTIAIEDAQADPPLPLAGLAALASALDAPLQEACASVRAAAAPPSAADLPTSPAAGAGPDPKPAPNGTGEIRPPLSPAQEPAGGRALAERAGEQAEQGPGSAEALDGDARGTVVPGEPGPVPAGPTAGACLGFWVAGRPAAFGEDLPDHSGEPAVPGCESGAVVSGARAAAQPAPAGTAPADAVFAPGDGPATAAQRDSAAASAHQGLDAVRYAPPAAPDLATAAEEPAGGAGGRHRGRAVAAWGAARRRDIAGVYRAAQSRGEDPVLAVMAATGFSRRRSLRLIAGARDEGRLPARRRRV